MIKLGSKVKDNITGFSGIAVARTIWLFGCNRIAVESTELKDGFPVEAQWFDEQRVELLSLEEIKISPDNSAATGGPQKDPVQRKPDKR